MKIIMLVSSLGAGGAERVATTLCNAWSARGDQVTLMPTFSGRGECFYELSPDVSLVYLADLVPSRKRSLVNQFVRLKALRRFFAADRPDAIVSFLSNVNVATVLASAGLGIPVMVCERTDPFVFPSPLLLKLAMRVTYPLADALVVQTQAVSLKFHAAKWHLQRVSVIHNPVPLSLLDIKVNCSRDGNQKCLLAVGRLAEEKQFDVLIKVFSNLANSYSNWTLRIIGEGPSRPVLSNLINELGLEGRVELPGRFEDIGAELVKADAFVLSSKVEGFPNVLLEAMAVGLPCVAFDCPCGPREMTIEGQVALLVPLGDEQALEYALVKLMLDENFRESLGSRGRISVMERFTLAKILGQWDSLFKTVGIY